MADEPMITYSNKCKCVAWQPIVYGSLVATGLSFLANLFAVAIGLTGFTTNSEGVETLAFGGLIGISISIIASMFASGWLTGYLGGNICDKGHLGALYGFLAWVLALIIAIFLMSQAQEYVSFYGHFISGTENTSLQVINHATKEKITTNLSPKMLAINTYIVFILFFLSALSCSLGGHFGMRNQCREKNQD